MISKVPLRMLLALGIALVVLAGAAVLLLDEYGSKIKVHFHVPLPDSSFRFRNQLITFNQDAIEILEAAERHDQAGEVDLATDDYKYGVATESFKQISGRPRAAIEELADTRSSAKDKDYFSELVCHSRVTFWPKSRMPIKVFVPDSKRSDGFSQIDRDMIKNAFDEWVAIVPSRLSYVFVNERDKADIAFSQVKQSADLGMSQTVMAHTVPVTEGPAKWRVGVISKVTIDVVKLNPPIVNTDDTRKIRRNAVFLHEVGHSLGLDGHSCNGNDLMFFQNVVFKLTDRDRSTFRMIYDNNNESLQQKSEETLRQQAKNDNKYALIQLASVLREAGTASKERIQEVFSLAKRAADLGLARAQLWVGFMYANGDGVKRDLHKAAEYYELAAKQDVGSAYLELANLYQVGEGVPQDVGLAQNYLRRAVRVDSVPAELAYADFLCYQFGDAQSYLQASKFYALAANKNSGEAMARLSKLYSHGYGVPKDDKLAEQFMRKALTVIAQQHPKDAEDYYSRGLLYHEIHRSKEAIADFSEALKLRPQFRNGYLNRAMELDEIGEHRKALDDYTAAIKIDPDSVNGYYARCLNYLCLNQPEKALQDVRQVLDRTYDPDHHRMYAMLYGAFAFKMLHDEDSARKMIDDAYERSIKDYWPGPIVSYMHGDISADQLEKLARGDQRGTEARAFLGVNQALSGDRTTALKTLNWVKNFGDGHFYEYPIAITTLAHLEKSTVSTKAVPLAKSSKKDRAGN